MSGLFKFIMFSFLFLSLIPVLTRRWVNPWKLYLVFGKKGSGKSTFLTRIALKYIKKGFTVYTNMDDLILEGVRHFNVDDLGDFVPEADSLMLIDEVGMIWDNRNFKNFKTSTRDFFKLQRHYHVLVYLASQTFDVDKKIRDLTDGMYLCVNVFNVFSVAKKIYRKVVLTEAAGDQESRISENLKFAPFWNWQVTFIPKYSKYFNSFTVPDLPKLRYRVTVLPEPVPDLRSDRRTVRQLLRSMSPKLNKIFILFNLVNMSMDKHRTALL